MAKQKICPFCKQSVPAFWKAKTRETDPCCKKCVPLHEKKYGKKEKKSETGVGTGGSEPKQSGEKVRYSTIKQKVRKPTGELKLFLEIYAERKGVCEVTDRQIPFNVSNFAHILSKGAYGRYRLNKDNIIHVHPDVHNYYDNSSKEELLKHYPKASIIYEKKEILKQKYYSESKTPTFGSNY